MIASLKSPRKKIMSTAADQAECEECWRFTGSWAFLGDNSTLDMFCSLHRWFLNFCAWCESGGFLVKWIKDEYWRS